jgi:hypothetical protein
MKDKKSILLSTIFLFFSVNLTNAGTWNTLDFPGASQTHITGIDGSNIVGYYGPSYSQHGFIYDGTNWTTIDMPTAKSTQVHGISGNVIVGEYSDPDLFGIWYSFFYDGTN